MLTKETNASSQATQFLQLILTGAWRHPSRNENDPRPTSFGNGYFDTSIPEGSTVAASHLLAHFGHHILDPAGFGHHSEHCHNDLGSCKACEPTTNGVPQSQTLGPGSIPPGASPLGPSSAACFSSKQGHSVQILGRRHAGTLPMSIQKSAFPTSSNYQVLAQVAARYESHPSGGWAVKPPKLEAFQTVAAHGTRVIPYFGEM